MDSTRRFRTLADLQSIVDLALGEDLSLEYKASKVLEKSDTNTISKAVCAFANSVGGQLVVGIQSDEEARRTLDGGVRGASRHD